MSDFNEKAVVFCSGVATLLGVVHAGTQSAHTLGVVIVVGGPQYRVGSHRQFVLMARALASSGYDVFRFDYQGMGDSEGPYSGFERCEDDIRAAIDAFMSERPSLKGVTLFGLCDGASAALMYAPTDKRVAAVMLANPWVRSESTQATTYLKHYYARRLFEPSFWRKLLTGGLQITKSAGELAGNVQRARSQLAAQPFVPRMLKALQDLSAPILVLLSEQDLTAQEFSDVCASDKSWRASIQRKGVTVEALAGADHTFSARTSLDSAVRTSVKWLADVRGR